MRLLGKHETVDLRNLDYVTNEREIKCAAVRSFNADAKGIKVQSVQRPDGVDNPSDISKKLTDKDRI